MNFFFFSFFASPGSYRVYCVIGDAESAEGSVWEAMNFASQYKLNNLCAIFDINRLGQSDPTMFEHDLEHYKKKTEAFGYGRSFWDLITYMMIGKINNKSFHECVAGLIAASMQYLC